jgi:hypothetical protein
MGEQYPFCYHAKERIVEDKIYEITMFCFEEYYFTKLLNEALEI